MSIKFVLASLPEKASAPATLALAIRVGRDFNAHIEALHVKSDPGSAIPLVGEGMSAAMVEEMLTVAERQIAERSRETRQVFDAAIAGAGIPILRQPYAQSAVSASWREENGREEEILAGAAKLSDLVVAAKPDPASPASAMLILNALLMESGRGVLLAPARPVTALGRHVAVFWNGSAEAARAVAAALPFLERAERVSVLSARETEDPVPGGLPDYLAWHGVGTVESRSFVAGTQVGQSLLSEAGAIGADLIVMGAYTHSRLRQLILGGVTRHILQNAEIPVLFSH